MTSKQAIISRLAGQELLAPDLIATSLLANDQAKYYFALMQTARANADEPGVPPPDLKSERLSCRIEDNRFDRTVAGARRTGADSYEIPCASEILARLREAVINMLACLPEADRKTFRARLDRLPAEAPKDRISGTLISAMTSGDRGRSDSLHVLVMDVHRAINRLQAEIAVETIDGAHVHGLSEGGRARVKAFMEGLAHTAPLKFDHPGLGTTATEYDGLLLIQNDIGTTDAHVIVLKVKDLAATVTYSDVHRARLRFFKSLLDKYDVSWTGTAARKDATFEDGGYLLASGTFQAEAEADLRRFLAYLGSRLVFLIDWNKARKRLRGFVAKEVAISILKWAADNEFGHRALLEIGGERALAEAIEYAAGERLRYGDRLDQLLDDETCRTFLKFAFKTASIGLRERWSRRNMLDEIKAKLRRDFENARLGIFETAAAHAACGYDLAYSLSEAFELLAGAPFAPHPRIAQLAGRAARWESRADALLNEAREDIRRSKRPRSLNHFFERADDTVDELEEAASLVDLCAVVTLPADAFARLRDLSGAALQSAQGLVKCVECAASVTRTDIRDDLDEFLRALEELVATEHRADIQLRDLRRWLIEADLDQRQTILVRDLAGALENATDAAANASQALRGYLMDEVIA